MRLRFQEKQSATIFFLNGYVENSAIALGEVALNRLFFVIVRVFLLEFSTVLLLPKINGLCQWEIFSCRCPIGTE